jgi:Zeta toxin
MIWTGDRHRRQGRLVAELYQAAAAVPCEQAAVIVAGLPGADKAAALGQADVDGSRYLLVSIDAVLLEMAARRLIPEAAGQSPLERAGLVHGEAQFLAKRIGLLALADGRNLLLDISLASRRAAESWTYALRFAGYAVTAVFADIDVDEAVRRTEAARRRGEEEYRRGRGYGGRRIPAEAIRALADPAAAEPRNRIRWASGARAAGAMAGRTGPGTFPGSAVTAMLAAYTGGTLSMEDLELEFRARRWPQVPAVCPPDMERARAAIDDPEPYVPGSCDDVVLAYDRGWLSDADYEILARAAAEPPGPDHE